MICLSRPYPFKFFKGCLPQTLLGPFLNNLPVYYLMNTIMPPPKELQTFLTGLAKPGILN